MDLATNNTHEVSASGSISKQLPYLSEPTVVFCIIRNLPPRNAQGQRRR